MKNIGRYISRVVRDNISGAIHGDICPNIDDDVLFCVRTDIRKIIYAIIRDEIEDNIYRCISDGNENHMRL